MIPMRISIFTTLQILFISLTAHADTVTLKNGKQLKNVTVKMEKTGVKVTSSDGITKTYAPEEVKSTDFSEIKTVKISKQPKAVEAVPEDEKRDDGIVKKTENISENTEKDSGNSESKKPENKQPTIREAFKYRFQKIKSRIRATYIKIRKSLGLKMEKAGRKLQQTDPKTQTPEKKDNSKKNQ